MARLDKWESKHLKDVERYARQIEAIYQSAVREAAAIGATIPNFNPNKPFSFANYPSTKARIEKLLQTLKTGTTQVYAKNGHIDGYSERHRGRMDVGDQQKQRTVQRRIRGIRHEIITGTGSQVLQHQRQSLQSVHGTQNRWTEIV